MHDNRAAHLAMIQSVITRMANNSFVLKGWNVTLVSALFALAAKDSDPRFIMIAFLPTLTFWMLDAYYLRQERLFRKLYDDAANPADTGPSVAHFSMSTAKYESDIDSLGLTIWTPSIVALHGTIVATIIVVLIIHKIF